MTARAGVLVALSLVPEVSGCAWLNREKRIREPIQPEYSIDDAQFRRTMGELLGAKLVEGNDVVELLNGDEIFPAMIDAIEKAEKSVTIETFIWSSGKVSDKLIDALVERGRAGVKIRIIVDAVGSARLKKKDRKRLEESGAQIAKFNPPLSFKFFRANLRTHRKIMVVDGKVGFSGGVCISDDWQGDAQPPYWRETHLRVEGPVVAQMQAVFMENWMQTRSEVLHGEEFFPKLEPKGSMTAQFVKSGPKESAENIRVGFLLSIAAAKKSIRIAHVYFAPDTLMIDSLIAAKKRGVRVEVLVPKKSDNILIGKAARPRWQRLADAGVLFWEYEPTLYHCKIMIVDDVWSIVGSANFDERSFKLQDEANLNVLDGAFAKKLIETFEADKARSTPLTAKALRGRGFFTKLSDHFAGIFRPQL